MRNFFIGSVLSLLTCQAAKAQSFAINNSGAAANSSAILDVQSTSKGLLLPRMTKAQKNAIPTPATGLLVYQSAPDSIGFHYYNGTQWVWLDPFVTNAWKTTGNSGTDTATNFLGTTDAMPLAFRVNNEASGRVESSIASANTFLGFRSGRFTTGNFNSALGNRSLSSNVNGNSNTAIGAFALAANTGGSDNIALGNSALLSSTISSSNLAIGTNALRNTTVGPGLIALGTDALAANTTGSLNMAIGYEALASNTNGSNNIALGLQSLRSNTGGIINYAMGFQSLFSNTTGGYNLALGMEALRANTIGVSNIAIGGWQNMYRNTTGSGNISIGAAWPNVGLYNNTTGSSNISIGGNLYNNTTGNNNIALGFSALNNNVDKDFNIAIGSGALFSNGFNSSNPIHAVNNIGIGASALSGNRRGSGNVVLGNSAALTDTAQDLNVAIGYFAMNSSKGDRNVAVGASALLNNTGQSNVALGESAMIDSAGSFNVAVGREALRASKSSNNTAIGFRSMRMNVSGTENVAIGDSAAFNSNASGSVAIGSKAMFSSINGVNTVVGFEALKNNIDGFGANTVIGTRAMNTSTLGQQNTVVGYEALAQATTASAQTAVLGNAALQNRNAAQTIAIGSYAGYKSSTPVNTVTNNIYVGFLSGSNSISDSSIFIGANSGANNIGDNNMFIGHQSGINNNGSFNLAIGEYSGPVSGNENVTVGRFAGYFSNGSRNVYIGRYAGYGFAGSDQLAIDNSNTTYPLIYGNFATNLLRINGTLDINNAYSFPTADGAFNQVLRTNGFGTVSWTTISGESTTANNGLTLSGSNIQLGGSLTAATAITHGNFNLTHSLTGTGNFIVNDGVNQLFRVGNNGYVGINSNNPQFRLHIVNTFGGDGPFGRGIMIENNNAVTTGEASIAFKNAGPDGIPSNRAWISGLNNNKNYVIAYGDSLIGKNVFFRADTTGNIAINPQGPNSTRMDINGDLAIRINTVPVNNGMNNDVDPGRYSFIKVTGTSAAFSLSGFAGGQDGKILTVVNLSGNNMTIVNQGSSASLTTNRINTLTGADITTVGNGSITLQYSSPDNRWIVIAVRD